MDPVRELFDVASRTHPGSVREANEDHCETFSELDRAGLLVADGVSGGNGGGTASRMAGQLTFEGFRAQASTIAPAKRLYRAAQRANLAVHDLAAKDPALLGMATTLTAVVLFGNHFFAVHVGDSRLYLYRHGRLRQLTRDHTVSAERARIGLLSKARVRQHPGRSTLTRSLGRELIVRLDELSFPLLADDVLVVCSDGIHGLLDESEIASACRLPSALQISSSLVENANRCNAYDNVSAAVARVTELPPSEPGGSGWFARLRRSSDA